MKTRFTPIDDKYFAEALSGDLALILFDVIRENYPPEEVFSESVLEEWALENGFQKEDQYK